jgi:hypothetical protein
VVGVITPPLPPTGYTVDPAPGYLGRTLSEPADPSLVGRGRLAAGLDRARLVLGLLLLRRCLSSALISARALPTRCLTQPLRLYLGRPLALTPPPAFLAPVRGRLSPRPRL